MLGPDACGVGASLVAETPRPQLKASRMMMMMMRMNVSVLVDDINY